MKKQKPNVPLFSREQPMLTEDTLRAAFRTWPVEEAGEELKNRIYIQLDLIDGQNEVRARKEKNMRFFTKKKVVLAVAAIGLLGSLTVYAAGKLSGTVSHSWTRGEYSGYDKIVIAYEEAGFTADVIEKFSNGYAFAYADITEGYDVDEEGNALEGTEVKELYVTYRRQGSPDISLFSGPAEGELETTLNDEQTDINGITGWYSEDTYKFVPPGYEMTQEDIANQEKPGYYISYGSDEVEIQVCKSIQWDKDGIRYSLSGFDINLSREEIVKMAKELTE